jgi:hypothetical protein
LRANAAEHWLLGAVYLGKRALKRRDQVSSLSRLRNGATGSEQVPAHDGPPRRLAVANGSTRKPA